MKGRTLVTYSSKERELPGRAHSGFLTGTGVTASCSSRGQLFYGKWDGVSKVCGSPVDWLIWIIWGAPGLWCSVQLSVPWPLGNWGGCLVAQSVSSSKESDWDVDLMSCSGKGTDWPLVRTSKLGQDSIGKTKPKQHCIIPVRKINKKAGYWAPLQTSWIDFLGEEPGNPLS